MNNNENGFNENEFEIKEINEITEEPIESAKTVELSAEAEIGEIAEKTENSEETEKKEEKGMITEVFEWVQAIAVALVLALFLRSYVFTLVKVQGNSMVPTLQNNERLLV